MVLSFFIGICIATVVYLTIAMIANKFTFNTLNPFYNFWDSLKEGAWGVALLVYISTPLLCILYKEKTERLEKCNVKWHYNEELKKVDIKVSGNNVESSEITFKD